MSRALVLNASYEPLCIVSSRRALLLTLNDKASIVHSSGETIHSETLSFSLPSVIRLNYFVKVPYRAHMTLSRRAIFARDGYRCQYCDRSAENIDHIIPKSRGGQHIWENVVAACRKCNSSKRDRLLSETSMHLRSQPSAPLSRAMLLLLTGSVLEEWRPFLESNSKISA